MEPVAYQRVTSTELRCKSKLQGIIKEFPNGKFLEVRCKDKWCAERGTGTVVFHYFDLETGKLDHTVKYRDPRKAKPKSVNVGEDGSNTIENEPKSIERQ